MATAGVVGLGDMGSGLAKNLIAHGFSVTGYDPAPHRMDTFVSLGGHPAADAAAVGAAAEIVFIMVMNGNQVREVIFGADGTGGLASTMAPGRVIVVTATIKTSEMVALAADVAARTELQLIDSPVSGGFPGAQGGTLTMMAAGSDAALEEARPAMEAVSATIHRVGTQAGEGQTVKACLQSLIGAIFSATFEAAALAAKAGVPGEVLHKVVSTSSAGCGVSSNALEKIIDRQFEGTGSHINTMHKDLTISLDLARELGVPLFTASTAFALFEAGRTKHPTGDNWIVTRVLEDIVGAELHRAGSAELHREGNT